MNDHQNHSAIHDQLFQVFKRLQPTITPNQVIGQPQLFSMINQLSLSATNTSYDDQTFEELIERVQQLYSNLTINNFLEVYLQATNILQFRIEQMRVNQKALQEFIQQLQMRIGELSSQPNYQNQEGMQIVFKQFSILNNLPSNQLKIRIVNEAMNIDQEISFQNNGSIQTVKLENQTSPIDNLLGCFQIEVYDNQRNFGFATLYVYQLDLKYPKKVILPLSLDSMNTEIKLEVEGNVYIMNQQYAQEDLNQLRLIQSQNNDDLVGLDEQYRGLTAPFQAQMRPNNYSSSVNNQQAVSNILHVQQAPQDYSALQSRPLQHKLDSEQDDCDISGQSLIKQIHMFLIGFLVAAIVFCVKRQMFLDVTIAISFLAVLYKIDLPTNPRSSVILKFYSFIFVFSAIMDLAWLIVFFPQWNRDATSEDQGAQSLIRIIVLGASLLFMVYKILLIVAVIYLQSSIVSTGAIVKQNLHKFLHGEKQVAVAAAGSQPGFSSAQGMHSSFQRPSHQQYQNFN